MEVVQLDKSKGLSAAITLMWAVQNKSCEQSVAFRASVRLPHFIHGVDIASSRFMLRVSDAGRSQRCGLHRGRRPKAFNEGTRGKWQAVAPRAPSAMEVCARRRCVRATDADECVG